MKTLSALILLTLASAAFAQDLDSPRCGVEVAAPRPSVYDALLARMATVEGHAYAAEALNPRHGDGWRLWLGYYEDLEHEIAVLAPLERDFFRVEVYSAFYRLIAAGLN